MTAIEIVFWASLVLVFYTYLGYGLILFFLIRVRRMLGKDRQPPVDPQDWPVISLVVACYNEEDWVAEKIRNHLSLDYPADRIQHVVITDGSDDRTEAIAREFEERHDNLKVYHSPERRGKIHAVQRVMDMIDTPIVVFTDANTTLNNQAVKLIVRHYNDPSVGGVAGEKRIHMNESEAANAAGEGLYWKYESKLKEWDSELYSVVGAAGELFSIRKSVYQHVPPDTVIEDFYMTLSIAADGHRIEYEPSAFAVEGASASVSEELKRKIRIAAGGLQSISRLTRLLNPFRYGVLSFQYVSHRVLRWTLTPVALLVLFLANAWLAWQGMLFYQLVFAAQIAFYTLASIGSILARRELKIKAFFIPYYFFIMNYAVFAGFWRNIRGTQSVLWEKAKRS